jgi:thiol:disulfide interchange protein/DsbC/DsbD-like thiol-disulfide interchange protein
MQRWRILCLFGCLMAGHLQAANTQAKLIVSAESARPGETVMAGIRLTMAPGWHTYWRNAGDSGSPTTITWSLPQGITAGDVQWPVPEKLAESDLTTYIYTQEVVLLVPLNLATNLRPGRVELQARVAWLECEKLCVQGTAEVKANLAIGDATKPSANAGFIASWQERMPKRDTRLLPRATWDQPPTGDTRPVILEAAFASPPARWDFFPYASDKYEVQAPTDVLPADGGVARLRKGVKKMGDGWPAQLPGVLVVFGETGGKTTGYEISPEVATLDGKSAVNKGQPTAAGNAPGIGQFSLFTMLVYAFLGGLILNVMPCVLPVIALKILGFVRESQAAPGKVRKLGLFYAMGVLVSFLALALLVLAVKAAGHDAGWGMQFGNPEFLVVLTILVTLVALNLFGVFEVNPGGKVLGTAAELASKSGAAGAFFNGVLATVLATPCTAPYLGTALGFAFAQSPAVIILMLMTVGVGLATPYVILSCQPAWLKFLPKPGVWMERFKIAMGFPMLATAMWLFSLTLVHYGGQRVLWLGLFLVVVGLAAWIYGEFVQRGGRRKGLAVGIVLVLLASGYGYGLEGQLRWRTPMSQTEVAGSLKESPEGIEWRGWSPEAVAQARAEGRPVLVDFTANWCLVCQVNKKVSLEIAEVRAKLKEIRAVALLGDYSTSPPRITAELKRFGRAGVPLVLVYPKEADRPPIVLPEILTPQRVLKALADAAG